VCERSRSDNLPRTTDPSRAVVRRFHGRTRQFAGRFVLRHCMV